MIEVEVAAIALDPKANQPVLLLKPSDTMRLLPIPLGQPEAMAILSALQNVELLRPMTHDLMMTCFKELNATLIEVRIVNYREGIFYAELLLKTATGLKTIDARPSDAVALAVRAEAPIYVTETIFEVASVEAESITLNEEGTDEFMRHMPQALRDSLEGSLFDRMQQAQGRGFNTFGEQNDIVSNGGFKEDEAEAIRSLIDFADPDDFIF